MASSTPRSEPLASTLVARFLRANNYTETLDAFIHEAGLPVDAGQAGRHEWTIEQLLEEKQAYDQSLKFERHGDGHEEKDIWTVPAPAQPSIVETRSNLLASSVDSWQGPMTEQDSSQTRPSYIVATGADRQVHLVRTRPEHDIATSLAGLSDSPILSYVSTQDGAYMFMTSMSGHLLLLHGSEVVDRRKEHTKYAVQVVAYEDHSTGKLWVATAGWDMKIFVYSITLAPGGCPLTTIGEPVGRIDLLSNPESMLFLRHPDTGDLVLLASRRDSTYLFYYQVGQAPVPSPERASEDDGTVGSAPYECRLLGKQNLAPHSTAWVAFSPACLAVSPHDPSLLAVATSTLPHMKLIIVRLLFPPIKRLDDGSVESFAERERSMAAPETQAAQALAALSLQNREDAAIVIQTNTFAPQTAYSTPQVVWRPDGSGIWVNGDDGVVRGIEAKTGKVVAILKEGHEPGSKVRTIWAGWVKDEKEQRQEWLISGGFDKRLVIWK
ncbi:hypothetical protein ASPZODRAFT_63761 [Penicilliopsis zonata CBS 506.65]|uniref:Uncharacterized protein n=1 Tax=Penicilliopsis zonata CBS 506.65 TaxID=1073090 RepID=A0A1L9SL83_9EURO|nr:hypothetical protein ASPZODRAFT_63761 [Penicilliopsis zonata CBS 506.65]OJJ47883.1 hypothetical protein ASPZODRAFT_63761 [Penicilliopsis zonata CBS 506.65]